MTRHRHRRLVLFARALAAILLFSIGVAGIAKGGNDRSRKPTSTQGGVHPIGRPSLIATLPRSAYVGEAGFDVDGDYIAWSESSCSVGLLRISDGRVRRTRDCWGDDTSALALSGRRVVWSTLVVGNTEAAANVFTSTFGATRASKVGSGTRYCEEAENICEFERPIIASSGGSLVVQFQSGDHDAGDRLVTRIMRLQGATFRKVPVAPGADLAVHGTLLAVARDTNVELRRIGDGRLIRQWPLRRAGRIALSGSLLVVQSGDPQRRIDLYDLASGQFRRTTSYRGVGAVPVANGVAFFAGRTLRYMGTSGRAFTLAQAPAKPLGLVRAGRRLIWMTEAAQKLRVYSLRLKIG